MFVLSRTKDKKAREDLKLGDSWRKEYSSSDEKKVFTELAWMLHHNKMKEYIVVSRAPSKKPSPMPWSDLLDDDVPF